ncbi:hypothetical protein CIK05_00325 [Bdellovibrio sp. qaytius]|nr:hypothetical protein CIK05_00325 [Bdellovibrio sp. qaytius]
MEYVCGAKKFRICGLVIFIFSSFANAEMPLDIPEFKNQYEINSETVYFSDNKLIQGDLRLLVGRKFDIFRHHDLRLAVGGYGLYQDSEDFDYSYRHGAVAQLKINLLRNWVFFEYEHHYFNTRDESDYQDENRYGLFGGYYYQFNERTALDIYAETFYIPNVSRDHLLNASRASIYWDTKLSGFHVLDLLAEVYAKDYPADWGGSRTDLRAGVKFQPWEFISAKIFTPVASSHDNSTGELQGQINIYKVGDF